MGNSQCCAEDSAAHGLPGGRAFAKPGARNDLCAPALSTPALQPLEEQRKKEAAAQPSSVLEEARKVEQDEAAASSSSVLQEARKVEQQSDAAAATSSSVRDRSRKLSQRKGTAFIGTIEEERGVASAETAFLFASSLSAGKFQRFEATLWPDSEVSLMFLEERSFDGLGIFVIGNFEHGPAAAWNAAQKSDSTRLVPGDRIVNINGAVCSRAVLLAAAKSNRPYTITIARWPEEFAVQLKRQTDDDKFGIKLELMERSDGVQMVRVGDIGKGLVKDWNDVAIAQGRLHEIITLGATLLEVSGERGSHVAMMSKLQSSEVILRVKRPEVATIERFASRPPVAG